MPPQFSPSQYSATVQYFLKNLIRWLECFLPTYLTPKSSTMSMKLIVCVSFYQNPIVLSLWRYPCFSSRSSSSFWDIIPSCGKPYIPRTYLTYTKPLSYTFSRSLQCLMTSSGKLLNIIRKNSGWSIGVLRYKSFKSNPKNYSPGVHIILLSMRFIVNRLAVGVLQSVSICKLSPPNVSLV